MDDKTLAKAYDHKLVESIIYDRWQTNGYFRAEPDPGRKPFSIVIPPPNVTGSLHIGHALNNTLQDIVTRKKRMEGYAAMWLPGTDHAGIATQNVVEREIAKEGKTRQELGREEFVKRVWAWKATYGEKIINQLKELGCSCDWERERFTMDEGYSRAVREVFKRLYDDRLIYRGSYIINWCPRCLTALSDIEVEHEDRQGALWYIKYPFKGGDGAVTVATTRPETMLGDTAVAVNPKDDRYKDIVGKTLILPLLNREIPVIADDFIDPEFGTGAVKVTPSHDPNDFDIGLRHKLPQVNIFTEAAVLNENAGRYAGLDRTEGRAKVLKDLKSGGFLLKEEEHLHAVGHCYRCHTTVEPYQSLQWFVKMKPLAEPAIAAVREGRTVFHPKRWEKIYYEWMENIRDWCISRQLWWGHRIPVWYCGCGETIVAVDDPASCPKCGSKTLKQDEDVLDTWFSSWLWPFATMGWPENTPILEYFYPTSLLSTAFDIIFFWVARMIMAGLYFTGDVPFRDVYVHALIRDAEGTKMSKSRGNVIDPLDVLEWSGTDALRLTLATLAVPGRDVLLSEDRIEGYRHFINKLWNASRFVLMNLEGYDPAFKPSKDKLEVADRWILSRLAGLTETVETNIETYNFSEACNQLYSFVWGDFCDWYIEWSKGRLAGEDRRTVQYVLVQVLDTVLRLLHPVTPFVTEEIWRKLPEAGETIMLANWPKTDKAMIDREAEKEASFVIELVSAIRQARHDSQIARSQSLDVELFCEGDEETRYIENNITSIFQLTNVNFDKGVRPISEIKTAVRDIKYKEAMKFVVPATIGYMFPPGGRAVNKENERLRLEKKLGDALVELEKAQKKLANKGFTGKAASEIVEKVRRKEAELKDMTEKLRHQLDLLEG